ncbi:MAG: carbohydrate ABC transporter permease [Verrucomicrobiota bacterium]|nr:carbohydrate ABC transporter permease [Verrucomicrobiota bacterium]
MPVILPSEKGQLRSRLVYFVLYASLAVGSITMVYPFLLMASGSLKSRVDVQDLDLVPRFIHDDALLFRKYVEAKYNERIEEFRSATGSDSRNFRAVTLPEPNPTLVADWTEFVESAKMPTSWFLTAFGPTQEGKIIQRNERAFRQYVSDLCDNDLDVFHERFDEPIESWFFLKFPPERLTDRKYQLSSSPLIEAFYAFKQTLSLEDQIYVSCNASYLRYLKLAQLGGSDSHLKARSNLPEWEAYVRGFLHPQFISVDKSQMQAWAAFLENKYEVVAHLNKLYSTDYSEFGSVAMPNDKITASAQLSDFLQFISNSDLCELEALSLDTPELRWQMYLENKYRSIGLAAFAHGRHYKSFSEVRMPQLEADREYVESNASDLRFYFGGNNYRMVLEYIFFYGRGIENTLIYCLAAIALALLVNPLAAYALSRYKLPGQFRVLLFLIATMAFPGVVTMIPNFLLLRDLGLLNTFAALLLPTMANGYSIFLLKGFFDSLPQELFEAADIDGASEWQKFWMITMNLSKPILAVIALGAFNGAYANFMYAFILCQDKDMWTLTVWLYQLQQFSSQGVVFASLMIAAVPTLLIFIFCQKVIIQGIVVPTEK